MDFFGIGSGELILILLLALIIWGPGRIPEIARTLGKTVRAFKKASFDLTSAVTREIEQNSEESKPKEASQNKTRPTPSAVSEKFKPGKGSQDKAGQTPSVVSQEPGEASTAK